jgi:hypothetical protein
MVCGTKALHAGGHPTGAREFYDFELLCFLNFVRHLLSASSIFQYLDKPTCNLSRVTLLSELLPLKEKDRAK